jgi:4-amino-4-deoxy-L-arabinose transferase-like glycosyltransferase
VQSFIFVFGSIGLLFTAVGLTRTVGQAALAVVVFISAHILFDYGYAQISDIPLSFFALATCTTMYLYFKYEKPNLLILSGFSAGLAAWTKNEGILFVVSSSLGFLLLFRSRRFLVLSAYYLAGLALPLAVVLYFKLGLAPNNDIFSATDRSIVENIMDPARYWLIATYFFKTLADFTGIPGNIFIQLGLYAMIVKFDQNIRTYLGNRLIGGILVFQFFGYCLIYLFLQSPTLSHLSINTFSLFQHHQ